MTSVADDPPTAYDEQPSVVAARLDGALQSIREDEQAKRLTARQAADNRVAVLEAHLAKLAELRREYLPG
jgi:hypothetical protein